MTEHRKMDCDLLVIGAGLRAEEPDHPYGSLGHEQILQGFDFVKKVLGKAGLAYHLSGGRNLSVLTAMGILKPSFMVPETMEKGTRLFGETTEKKALLVIDIKGL